MTLDVRRPIGAFFSLLGALLTGYGAATRGDPAMRPVGIPIDFVWGVALLIFGVALWLSARRARSGA